STRLAERWARKSTPRSTRFSARYRSSGRSSSRSSGDAMDHLDRDDLILLHYGEKASPGAREHLLGCEECRRESALLRRVLDAVDDAAETPELAPAWEEQLWNRLRWKLERPRSRWIGWAAAAAATIAIADREAMEDLVRKNRLYLDAAYTSGQTSLASVLEEMQPLLLELARAPENPSARDIEMLQKRIEKRGSVLKLRVAGEQIRQRQSL